MAFCVAARQQSVGGISFLLSSSFLRKKRAFVGNALCTFNGTLRSLRVKHITASNPCCPSCQEGDLNVGATMAAAVLVVAGAVVTTSMKNSNATRNHDVALMEEESHHDDSLLTLYEPGSVEEIQHFMDKCLLGSRHAGGIHKQRKDRLMSMVPHESFTKALMEYMRNADIDIDETSHKLVDDKFPSLQVKLLNENCGSINRRFEFNSREPIPIENDFFSGHIQINLHSHSAKDKRDFDDAKNMFEIQLQGRFKRIPEGVIYCGGELADENFRFSPWMKGLANALLKLLVRCIGNDLEYSFGGSTDGGLPFISFPMKTAMNDIIVTPAGETPPRVGQPFVETKKSRNMQKDSSTEDAKHWSLNETYSMSFAASSIDLTTWKVLCPFEANLSLFWGESPLRLVIYEKGTRQDNNADNCDNHQTTNNYLLALQIKYVGTKQDLEIQNTDQPQSAQRNAI